MKDNNLKIQGEKVFLRYVTLNDFEEFLALNRSSLEFYKGLVNPPLDFESFKAYVERNRDEANECFVICQNVDNTIVGAINLSQIFRKAFQSCYLGYSLGIDWIGKGFMSEAVELVVQHAFENLKLHRVEANVQPHNLLSIRVLQRCGFSKEGFSPKYLKIDDVWCDHERWAIILEDWKERK
ncbi:MAG: GNAT family protein [Acidobacteriota bacterium]